MGITSQYLSNIERGYSPPPSPDIVRRIAQALRLDESQMLTLAEASRPPQREKFYSVEARRRISEARSRASRKGKKDSEAEKQATKSKLPCDFCEERVEEAKMSILRYEDEDLDLAICPKCFRDWQAKPDGAVIVEEKIA
jgi:transcriptional regulator with XRE-family HTH domain